MSFQRFSQTISLTINAFAALCFVAFVGCGNSTTTTSEPVGTTAGIGAGGVRTATAGASGAKTGTSGAAASSAGAMTIGSGGSTATTSSTAGKTTSTAGSMTSAAGNTAGSDAAGASGSVAGASGSTAGASGSATAGSSGAAGTGTTSGGTCPAKTAAGVDLADKAACTASDPQTCTKTCGVENKALKTLTCTSGGTGGSGGSSGSSSMVYDEGTCDYPTSGDYSCYKIPTALDSTCPTAIPQHGSACTATKCVVCNFGGTSGLTGGKYKTSSSSGGTEKEGFCVCMEANASGTRKWSCASKDKWPCPTGSGC